jgi:hypothetical protein
MGLSGTAINKPLRRSSMGRLPIEKSPLGQPQW